MISKKNIIIAIAIVVLSAAGIGGYYIYKNKASVPQNQEQNNKTGEEAKDNTPQTDTSTKEGLLSVLKQSGGAEDFENFAKYLKIVYQNQWEKDVNLEKTESEIYMNVTTKYFDAGNIGEALRISTIVYDEVPQGWRFRYLRIRSLEKLGRDAFNQNDLAKAEEYAMKILQMTFRPEGANLLADIYIKKVEADIEKGDKAAALNNLNEIFDYEISQDRRDKLVELRDSILK